MAATVPVVWLGIEFLRGTLGGGFAWYTLGQSQHAFLPIIQIADVVGMWGVSFVVAAVNGLIAAWLVSLLGVRRWLRLPELDHDIRPKRATVSISMLVLATLAYGLMQLQHPEFAVGPRVSMIQGNLEQGVRNARNSTNAESATQAIQRMNDHHIELSNQAASEIPKTDLIIWPETSYPLPWVRLPPEKPAETDKETWENLTLTRNYVAQRFVDMGKGWNTHALIGLNTRQLNPENTKSVRFNTALLIDPTGQPMAFYHKMHRVPFGEYIPFKESLPLMKWLSPYDYEYGIEQGSDWSQFTLPANGQIYRFGVLICYEDSDPTLARQYNARVPVDFLVNISNDGWFRGTEEHEQHLAVSRFRAIESRRSLVRAVNMGISAIINSDGAIVAMPGPTWAESKAVAVALTASVPIDDRASFYADWGDWLPLLCLTLTFAGCVVLRDPRTMIPPAPAPAQASGNAP